MKMEFKNVFFCSHRVLSIYLSEDEGKDMTEYIKKIIGDAEVRDCIYVRENYSYYFDEDGKMTTIILNSYE